MNRINTKNQEESPRFWALQIFRNPDQCFELLMRALKNCVSPWAILTELLDQEADRNKRTASLKPKKSPSQPD